MTCGTITCRHQRESIKQSIGAAEMNRDLFYLKNLFDLVTMKMAHDRAQWPGKLSQGVRPMS